MRSDSIKVVERIEEDVSKIRKSHDAGRYMSELLQYAPRHWEMPSTAGLFEEQTWESTEALANITNLSIH